MRKERVKKWDVRSFEQNYEAELWLNELENRMAGLKVEGTAADEKTVTLVVSYITDEE